MSLSNLKNAIEQLRACMGHVGELRKKHFPLGTVVVVDCDQFKGQAIVSSYECRPDQLACRIGNGNTWWYPLDTIRPINEGEQIERWIVIETGKGVIEQRCRCGNPFMARIFRTSQRAKDES